MATIFNEQRRLGIRIVADGTTIFNNQPVIGVREAANGLLFTDNQRVIGVDVLPADQAVYNDQPVVGAVLISDARTMYNGRRVVPTNGSGGGGSQLVVFSDSFVAGADGTDLSARSGWTKEATGGRSAQTTGTNSIKHVVGVAPDTAYTGPDLLTAKHAIECDVATTANSTTFLMNGRVIDGLNNVGMRRNGSQWQLYKVVAGSFTSLGTSPQEILIGDTIRIVFDGDTATCYRNGVVFIGAGAIVLNAPELLAATKAGCVVRTSLTPTVSRIKMEALAA